MSQEVLRSISAVVDRYFSRVLKLAEEMISVPTVNPPGLNYEELAELVANEMDGLGLEVSVHEAPHEEVGEGGSKRLNVLGKLAFSLEGPSIHFHGHYDVVPASGGWSTEPFRPVVRDGKLYGRGASDMKAALAASVYMPVLAREAAEELDLRLRGEVLVSATPDEETGGQAGAGYLVEEGIVRGVDYTIVPEPTFLTYIWHVQKGCLWLKVILRGREAHGSIPHLGLNAFEKMAELALRLVEYDRALRSKVSKTPAYPEGANRASLAIGGMCGSGEAVNVVPGTAWFTIDRRVLPEESTREAEEAVMAVIKAFERDNPGVEVRVEELLRIEPSGIPADHELVGMVKKALSDVLDLEGKPVLCPGFLNTRYFVAKGMPAVAWGPGDLEQAHSPDEHIELLKLRDWLKAAVYLVLESLR
ncbi:succinyl-diaminopimelate desuccinylase [Candidatus Bathyarchaeota archaeon ex4484_135]|nr:MAG: succinyl-diaminopimelate desuccinylase [Candidatus Bathyarchaeota archaeon ex4484_135]